MDGRQYIIELEEAYIADSVNSTPKYLYRVKGFNSLVFDEEGLAKLTSLQDFKMNLLADIMKNFTKKDDSEKGDN